MASPRSDGDIQSSINKPKALTTWVPSMYQVGSAMIFLAVVLPMLQNAGLSGRASMPLQPVSGSSIVATRQTRPDVVLGRRSDSPTDVCFRWAQQSAVINGTLYLYGGEATTSSGQTENTWNNDFLSLDLTQSWQIANPPLTGLPQPSGPPNVSLGYLWNSHESLWLYGGEFSWKPPVEPSPLAMWEYSPLAQTWYEHSNPETSSGVGAPSNDVPVQRAAEGAGVSLPGLGRGFYFGGHLDGYTTPGWSQSIAREYLQSLLEFTFPGYTNDQVTSLADGTTAGSAGAYRNITQGGLQSEAGFTRRADGLLVHVPGFGRQGILLALAGGTNDSFTQMNNVNVYDIANSSWYTQATSGPTPNIRVNPCAVVAAAEDGSSFNIYMFGGQNLLPYGDQTQYDDMWILTIPSFTWIQVDQNGQSVPYGRSGQTCNIWDAQMVMVGGYVGDQLSCESPGIYVFDLSKLQWVNSFTASSPGSSSSANPTTGRSSSSTFKSTGSNNPFNQQPSQLYNSTSPGGLEGSYGYQVPDVVIAVIGGNANGGATATTPAVSANSGPLATGRATTYTLPSSSGATGTNPTQSANSGSSPTGPSASSTSTSAGSPPSSKSKKTDPSTAAIAVGVVAGVLLVTVCYLAFCAYVYRKQLLLYKRHLEMTQRQAMRGGFLVGGAEKQVGGQHPFKFGPMPLVHEDIDRNHIARTTTRSGGESASQSGSAGSRSGGEGASAGGYMFLRRSDESGSVNAAMDGEDLLEGREPTFVGVMLNPRRSLRVINRD